jgi:hypothetical protein
VVRDPPHLLIDTIDEMSDTVRRRRERFGISYVTVFEGALEAFAPVVAALAGH